MNKVLTLTNAVTVCNGKVTTTSVKIAEVFGKEHFHVIRDIEKLQVPAEWHKSNFGVMQIDRKIGNGAVRKDKAYTITRDGFTLLAMGFTGAKAMQFKIAYIEAFNAMEAKLRELHAAPVQPELPLADALPDMDKLFRMKYNGVPVVATQYLAEAFGMPGKQLIGVYRRHKKMFVDSVDVFRLKGLTGEIHKTIVDAFSLSPGGRFVNLWTASGVRKFQELLNKSFIPHKQLCCSEVSPAESRIPAKVAEVAPVRKESSYKFFLVRNVPKSLEEETELGKLARAFAKRDPEHGGLEALAEYNALRIMAKKFQTLREEFEKSNGWGGGAGIKPDGKLVSRMIF